MLSLYRLRAVPSCRLQCSVLISSSLPHNLPRIARTTVAGSVKAAEEVGWSEITMDDEVYM